MTPAQPSRPVSSNQPDLHPKLAQTVRKHLANPWTHPVSKHSLSAYRPLIDRLKAQPRPLVLDSFCGTGRSTARLAERHPGHLVIGVDRSQHRLSRHVPGPAENYLLLRARAEDIWCLLEQDGLRVQFHYLLYPNPWPKAKHLMRRVHGHPAFDLLLRLGGQIELRSNWRLYVEEFGVAMHLAGHRGAVARIPGDPPLTLFEEKYHRSGHQLWCYRGAVTNPGE